jgi:Tfp pilus assembly protein PilF
VRKLVAAFATAGVLWTAQLGYAGPFVTQQGTASADASPGFMQRLRGLATTNPLRGMMPQKPAYSTTPPAPDDVLSLDKPVGKPTPELLVATAKMSERQGQHDAARRQYQQAVIAAPNSVTALRAAAHFEDRQGEFPAAEHLYRRAMAASNGDASTLNDLALCVARQGKLEESKSLLQQAVAQHPQKALYRNNLATVFVELGDERAALGELMAVHPPAAAHFNVATLLEQRGQSDAAASYFAQAASIDPSLATPQVASTSRQPLVPRSTPLVDPRMASTPVGPSSVPMHEGRPTFSMVDSTPWTPASPATSLDESPSAAWTPAAAPAEVTPIIETQRGAAMPTLPASRADGPKLLPPVR